MSRLDDLIMEFCPDGIKYRSIGSLISRIRERGKSDNTVSQVYVVSNTLGIVRSEDYHDNEIHSEDTSNYTIIRPGMFAYNPSRLNIGSLGLLKNNMPGLVSPMYVVFEANRNVIDVEYLLYNLKSSYVKSKIDSLKEEGARFRFDFNRWDWIEIPVPPKEIQLEIVRILKKFSELTTTLDDELSARKQQFEYYRNTVLTFNENVVKLPLSKVAKVFRGKYITKKESRAGKIPVILGGQEPAYYIDQANHEGEIVVIARSGASAGYVSYWDEPIYITDGFGYEANSELILPKFLYYSLKRIETELNDMKRGAGVPHVSREMLSVVELSIPEIERQREIVTMLDKFNDYCFNPNTGLSAEIAAREKQFTYYRDKLLSFSKYK